MASYTGPLTENIVTKLDIETKALLAKSAEMEQCSMSVIVRRAIRQYLTIPETDIVKEIDANLVE